MTESTISATSRFLAGARPPALVGFLAQRDISEYGAGIRPVDWTFIAGLNIDSYSHYPITLAARPESGGGPFWLAPVTAHDLSTAGSTFTSPDITVDGPGYIFGGFSYRAPGPADGSSAAFDMDPVSPAVTLSRDYAYPGGPGLGFAPYSWFGYLAVAAAGTYSIELIRSAVPRDPTNPFGWILCFFPGLAAIVQSGMSMALGGVCPFTWPVPPGGSEPQSSQWGHNPDDLNGSARPRSHHVEVRSGGGRAFLRASVSFAAELAGGR